MRCDAGAASDRTHSTPFILLDSSCFGATVTLGSPGCCCAVSSQIGAIVSGLVLQMSEAFSDTAPRQAP